MVFPAALCGGSRLLRRVGAVEEYGARLGAGDGSVRRLCLIVLLGGGLPVSEINAAAVQALKLELDGSLKEGKASGSNVELTTSSGTLTIKGGVDKELTVLNGGVEQKYKFEKKTTTLADALISGSSSEIAVEAEDYWFMQSEPSIDELSDITAPIAPCVLDEPKIFSRPSLDGSRLITFNRKK